MKLKVITYGIEFALCFIILQSCISGGTHGFIKSYTYTVSKMQLLNAIDSVILKNENIKPNITLGYYNDRVNYSTLVINKDFLSYEYTIQFSEENVETGISICYIYYENSGEGGSAGNGKYEKTPIELREKMINVFETEFMRILNKKLGLSCIDIDGIN